MLYRWGIFLQNRATDISDPPEDMNSHRCTGAPHIMGHPDLRIIDLALPRLIPELLNNFVYLLDPGCANRVPTGFESAACVDRDLSTQRGFAISGKFPGLSFPAEPEVFDCTNLRDRETIVYLH